MNESDAGARSDAELLAAHVTGDREAFGELFARHRDRLWAVALRTSGNPEDAADGLQDGMIAAYRRAASFRGDAAVTTWLHRVVVNACLDRHRAARVRRTDVLPDDLEEYGGRGSLRSSAGDAEHPADPAEHAVRLAERQAVLDALRLLPPDQRAAIVLVDMEGYPVAEAAAILGCAVGTVKSRCSRGRTRLAVLLGLTARGEAGHAGRRNRVPDPGVEEMRDTHAPPAAPAP
ncbi:RNA polymerase sigma factor SigM [Nocardioides sp. zg-DK7169]|uniref:RNA polymerase sigma factor SigM n=1 Tax=Nocardioides sp. zg-DK7169 TaxID=2736600 RepID=UPI0015521FCC|nr:RNA polymerase sigma factor SigM [Nocardioides sp. zg-DK7169]NPC98763.1 RNA polymerase sigma factor SigM [Nocardioides sp. zg-DK7169]